MSLVTSLPLAKVLFLSTLAIQVEHARLSKMLSAILIMLDAGNPVVWIIGSIAVAIAFVLLRGQFTAEARERRRRAKSHRRIVSRKPGPTVRLAVDVDKPKRNRKR
jgi:hypothetical protein